MKIYKNLDINDLENETWKEIEGYEGLYQVSNFGRIESLKFKKERILKQHKCGNYFSIRLCKNGKCEDKYIHILVFEAHSSYKLKDDECVHHINEDKENNIFENLEKMPKLYHKSFHTKGKNNPLFGKHHSDETKNKIGEKQRGENNHNHKLTEEQVIQIKLLLKDGILTQREIADIFGVSRVTISKIKNGKLWNHI